ncbi:FAD-dependent thymidylate synthase [Rubrobacter aplysinae]|uniref:FAD-dependent thymidylate synthase n=1 Tax=Rubrobacter aplysinae TaxID=909625 RepID=UPI000AA6E5DE|nr:FAD-dependent thymidylate synthase [Rubrobacter aplysinae]
MQGSQGAEKTPEGLFTELGGETVDGFPTVHSPVRHTPAGTYYLRSPGVVTLSKPQTNVSGLAGFLEGFDPGLGFPAYIDDPTELPGSSQLAKTAGQLCFDDETEVLTDEGWKKFQDLHRTERVLTLNPETGSAEFQLPSAHQVYDYNGPLMYCEGKALSFAVTPDHRQWARLGDSDEYRFYKTEHVEQEQFAVRTAPLGWEGRIPEQVDIPGFEYEQRVSNQYGSWGNTSTVLPTRRLETAEEIRALALLCVYYATEGSLKRGRGEGIVIYGDHYDELSPLAETLDLKLSTWSDPRNGVLRTQIGGGRALRSFFERECGKGCAQKRLPQWILNLPANLLAEVWDTLVKTDGQRGAEGREHLVTTSWEMAGQAQEILCKLGFSSSMMRKRTPEDRLQVFVISKRNRTEALANKNARIEKRNYSGKVYCVTTGNGIVFVRRDGKPHFSGNCYASFGERRTTNDNAAAYFERLTSAGHGSVLEHANFSFLLYGISRSVTHELVRHRAGTGFSQISQRYVSGSVLRFVERPEYGEDEELHRIFEERIDAAAAGYEEMAERLLERQEQGAGLLSAEHRTDARKKVQQTARSLLPNETEAPMVFTGNARALRHIIEMRADAHAESEIRALALRLFACLAAADPILFGDYRVEELPDGTHTVTTDHRKA